MKKRYSKYIRPLLLILDILIINLSVYFIYDKEYFNASFLTYINLFWIISSLLNGFYKVYRYTKPYRILTLLLVQFSIFILGYFSYFGLFREGEVVHNQALVLGTIILMISIIKFMSFYALKKYRAKGQNYRNVIVLGVDDSAKRMAKLFKNETTLGYRFKGFFSNRNTKNKNHLGTLEDSKVYILEEQIDEIYCSVAELTRAEIKSSIQFANINDRVIKLIPDSNELYNKDHSIEYYDNTLVVLNVKKLPFEFSENHFIKRSFDIVFSIVVCLTILSWLYPILWVLIKLESRGPAIFKQKREGLQGREFVCYKFRSMRLNVEANQVHATKEDRRVTVLGRFLRKTSLDELPQFFNVFLGNMSVVGPRPHMESLALEYQKEVDNYLKRHAVKPGITGLAQISGYRGEIKKKSDIKNRVRLDIFYIENWSFLLDIKIIVQTVLKIFKGDEKAY